MFGQPVASVDPSDFSAVQPAEGSGRIGRSFLKSTTSGSCGSSAWATPAKASARTSRVVAAVFIPGSAGRVYSIDFNQAVCQDAMHAVATALYRRMVKNGAPTERGDYSAAGL